jgi:hypothetical protein
MRVCSIRSLGATVDFEHGAFHLSIGGTTTANRLVDYDVAGDADWTSDAMRDWVMQTAGVDDSEPTHGAGPASPLRRWIMAAAVAVLALLAVVAFAVIRGQNGSAPLPQSGSGSVRETTSSPESTPGVEPTPIEPEPSPAISEATIQYAKDLGGKSHKGESLYFIIGDSVDSESAALAKLEQAIPKFGDMQSYFVVQRSDGFQGMKPGWWVIIEAYRQQPSPENIQFGERGFPNAYVKKATVKTSDPIPVYEDLTGGN